MQRKGLKFIKHVRDAGGFERPILVYGQRDAWVGNRHFKSVSAAACHVGTLESPIRRGHHGRM